jgi:uncharacterized protein YjdB
VRSWVWKKGKKTYVYKSPEIHCLTGNTYNNETNAKRVTVKRSRYTVKVGKKSRISATVTGVKAGAKILDHCKKIRYVSSDQSVATVNQKGYITGKAKGGCTIFAIAPNGVYARIEVIVK